MLQDHHEMPKAACRSPCSADTLEPDCPEPDFSVFARQLSSISPSLQGYAISLTRSVDQADDLVQDTLERAWRSRAVFDSSRSLKSWLIVIMRNRFFDVVVAGRKTLQDVDGYHASRLSTGPDQQASVEYRQTLDLIDQLPRLYRQAMHAVVLNGLSYDHASQLFRCPIPTIKSRVQRARKALKDVIAA